MSILLKLVKQQIRLEESHSDLLLQQHINAAIDAAEKHTGRALYPSRAIHQTVTVDMFGGARADEIPSGHIHASMMLNGHPFNPQVQFIDGCFYFPDCAPGQVVTVVYQAGYASEEEFVARNAQIVSGILKYVAHAFENPGDGEFASIIHSGATSEWNNCRPLVA